MAPIQKESYASHFRAQRLNNQAAQHIEAGEYTNAVANLAEALRLYAVGPTTSDNGTEGVFCCQCHSCSLEGSMLCSSHGTTNTKLCGHNSQACLSSTCDEGGYYLYRQPIRVTSRTIDEGHIMGTALPLMITFNLALSYHLNVVDNKDDASEKNIGKVEKTLRLYELAHRLHVQACEADPHSTTIRFSLILANNLAEIHRITHNHESQHQLYLQELLKTIMYVVDFREEQDDAMDLEGFLLNTSRLALYSQCAGAA